MSQFQNIKNHSDEQLLAVAVEGDQQALKLLVEKYLPLVYSVSRRYLHHTQDAEDAAQETFVKIWRNLKKIDQQKPLAPWIGEIAKNTCLDLIKKRRAIPFSAFENEDGTNRLAEIVPAVTPSPSDLAEQSITKRLLAAAIQKLPPRSAEILSLYYQNGFNFREIAEKLNASLHTVKSRHRRAIIFLKKLLNSPY